MPAETQGYCDPRSRLAREKYFCLRPRPLERWLWSKRIPASAERVFWLHWQEGMQRGDWCSEIPLSRVARECDIDVSTVTRAYQLLTRLDCLRRTDQGRDPGNPFQQATALTEVRIPRELLLDLNRHPNRRANSHPVHQREEARGAGSVNAAMQSERGVEHEVPGRCGQGPTTVMSEAHLARSAKVANRESAPQEQLVAQEKPNGQGLTGIGRPPAPVNGETEHTADPFPGLTGRERVRAIAELVDSLSASERRAYQEALRLHQPDMVFDVDSKVEASARQVIGQVLVAMSRSSCRTKDGEKAGMAQTVPMKRLPPRKLTGFELGRLSRQLQAAASVAAAPELMRQVVWSIEAGALKRFDIRHAVHIALKKIREGHWTRPHRMPPNWMRVSSNAPVLGTCGRA